MEKQFDGIEQIVEDEYLDENLEYQDEIGPEIDGSYERQLSEIEIQNAIEKVQEIHEEEPEIVELNSEFADAKKVTPYGPFIIRYLRD